MINAIVDINGPMGATAHRVRIKHAPPTWAPGAKTFGSRVNAKSKFATRGRTSGMPWDGTAPCSASFEADNGPKTRRPIQGEKLLEQKLEIAWKFQQWSAAAKVCMEYARLVEGVDRELANDLRFVAEMALTRGLSK